VLGDFKNKKILLAPHSPMSVALQEYLLSFDCKIVGFIDKNKNDTNIYKIDKLDEVDFDIVLILSPNHFKAIYKEYLKYLPKEIVYQVTIKDYKYSFKNDITLNESSFSKPKNLQIENKFVFISKDFIGSNNKFFYIYCIQQNIPAVILTNNQEQLKELKEHNLPYNLLDTKEAYIDIISSKFIVLDQGNYTDLPPLHQEQKLIQLWHGVGLKKMSKLTNITYDYFISTSTWTNETNFKNIFLAKEFLNCGYPRNDIFNKEYKNRYSELFCDKSILNFVKNTNSKIALYMPTHRATNVKLPLDFKRLNSQLRDINFTMIIKLHPLVLEYYSNIQQQDFSNILFHNTQGDIYPILKYIDILVTDYSSIAYDFLFLNRPVIFFNYDYDEYISTRGNKNNNQFLFNYYDYTPGKKIQTQEHLVAEIKYLLQGNDDHKDYRLKIKNLFFDDTNLNSCELMEKEIK